MRTDPRRIWFEVLGLYLLGIVVLYGTGLLARLGGAWAENQGAVTAAYFLLVPIALLRFRGKDPAQLGIHGRRFLASMLAVLAAAVVVFPPYIGGYEVWSRWQHGSRLQLPEHPISYFPSEWRGRPDFLPGERGLNAWVEGESLRVVYRGSTRIDLAIDGCDCPGWRLVLVRGGLVFKGPTGACGADGLTVSLVDGTGFSCSTNHTDRLTFRTLDGNSVPVLAGAMGTVQTSGPVNFDRSFFWLLELLLLHLVVVAFPEEVFYRGYVQTRLAPLFRRRWRVLGVSLGGHVVIASALFALSHLVAIPSAGRLLVFFPGLLFGYLRERTGSVVAPAVLHALSNVLLEILVRYHSL